VPQRSGPPGDPGGPVTLVRDTRSFTIIAKHNMWDLLDWIESRRRRDAIPGRTALSYGERRESLGVSEP
jgi:hypothetical protein